MLQQFMIWVIGNVRFCLGRPGKNVEQNDDSKINSRKTFWSVDSFGALTLTWMDNGLVFLVNIVHTVMDVSKCFRSRPRFNKKTRDTLTQGKVHVWIPQILYDYNHLMWCIYLIIKKLSNITHIFGHRTWIIMFIQFLYVIIFHNYICYISHYPINQHYKPLITHKYFSMEIVIHF